MNSLDNASLFNSILNRALLKRSRQNDIEIPYNCGGVLANILSDGLEVWTIGAVIPQSVINQEMYDAVQTWDLRRPRTINYRSLAPILRLLNEEYPTGCVMWAVWAMTNLTTVLRTFLKTYSRLFSFIQFVYHLCLISSGEILHLGQE